MENIFALTDFIGRELLLFAAIWFFIGALDDMFVDGIWLWRKAAMRLRHKFNPVIERRRNWSEQPFRSRYAIFVPAWQEADVIEDMLTHMCAAWTGADIRIYVGCYPNDTDTIARASLAAQGDERIKIITHPQNGPTSKADCLNQLWLALEQDVASEEKPVRAVVLQDAEDIVHPGALAVFDRYLDKHDYVQIPVVPLVNPRSRWISGHYCDEFAEAHAKAMVVRNMVAAGLPAAGVGCAFSFEILSTIAQQNETKHGAALPFDAASLTEDYELGLHVHAGGGSGVFVRAFGSDDSLIATSELFPGTITASVRQKSRWMAGIALLGWERMGWRGNWAEKWMRLRDRRAILAAFVLMCGYAALVLLTMVMAADWLGWFERKPFSPLLWILMWSNLALLIWRIIFRFAFTTRQYGWREGLLSVPRILVANVISIMAARRALSGYIRELFGTTLIWEKTHHEHIGRNLKNASKGKSS